MRITYLTDFIIAMGSVLRTVIIDDDPVSTEVLKDLVSDCPHLELLNTFDGPVQALAEIQNTQVDLLILDIEMPKMTGLELIASLSTNPFVILVSSKKEYALEAFDYDVIDYLTKPPALPRFLKAVDKVLLRIKNSPIQTDEIFVKVDSQLVKFSLDEFYFFEAFGDYVKAHTKDKFHVIKKTLSSIEEALPVGEFQRIHRSYIVRLDKIVNIESSTIEIKKQILPISGSYKEVLMNRIRTL